MLASATPSSGQRHKADRINEAMTPNDIRPIALDLIFKSESGSKAYIPPSKNPRQPKEPVPSNACRHDMSAHGAAYDSAAQALIIEKKTTRIIALRNVVMIGLCEKLICGAGQCKSCPPAAYEHNELPSEKSHALSHQLERLLLAESSRSCSDVDFTTPSRIRSVCVVCRQNKQQLQ